MSASSIRAPTRIAQVVAVRMSTMPLLAQVVLRLYGKSERLLGIT